jgi:hypothetical protein
MTKEQVLRLVRRNGWKVDERTMKATCQYDEYESFTQKIVRVENKNDGILYWEYPVNACDNSFERYTVRNMKILKRAAPEPENYKYTFLNRPDTF